MEGCGCNPLCQREVFNLRRFTISRFDEPNGGGGGQLGYWFEEALLYFLRQSDLLRVHGKGLLSEASNANPFSMKILGNIPQKKSWLALGWRHFRPWFADAEHRLATGAVTAEDLVEIADANWAALETAKPKLLMEERQNTGDWVRQWRRALEEYPYFT